MKTTQLHRWHIFSLALNLAPLLYELPRATTVLCLSTSFFFFWKPPHRLLQILSLGSGFFFYFQQKTLLTPEAASSLMALVTCLKVFETQQIRDRLIFLMMNLLLSMFYILFSQTLFSTFLIFINYIFFILFLLDLDRQKWHFPSQSLKLSQLLNQDTLVAIPLLVLLFIFFPRFTTSLEGWGVAAAKERIGFSDSVEPGKLSELATSEQLAFRFIPKTTQPWAIDTLYFRGTALSRHEGWRWFATNESLTFSTSPEESETADYEILLEPRFQKNLFVVDSTKNISLQPPHLLYARRTNGDFELRWPALSSIKITGRGHQTPQDPPQKDEMETSFRPSQKLKEFLAPLQTKNEKEKIEHLLLFFQKGGFQYSLNTPEYSSIEDFLWNQKIGYCEHFASSFAILARLLKIPSRVIIGFQGAEYNSIGNYYVVRDKWAHAWNEVYLQERGWTRIDVTSLVAPQRMEAFKRNTAVSFWARSPLQWAQNISMFWDVINSRYNLLLMNYNLEQQLQLLEKIGFKKTTIKTLWLWFLATCLCFLILFWLYSKRSTKQQDLLAKSYQQLKNKIVKAAIPIEMHEGPLKIREKLHKKDLNATVDLMNRYIALRFGPFTNKFEILRFSKDVRSHKICFPTQS